MVSVAGLSWEEEAEKGCLFFDRPAQQKKHNAAEVGGVSANALKYVIVDFPGYVSPCMIDGHPTYVCIGPQQIRTSRCRPCLARSFHSC